MKTFLMAVKQRERQQANIQNQVNNLMAPSRKAEAEYLKTRGITKEQALAEMFAGKRLF